MNREALFCDGTGDYVCPAEPEINEKVVLRFRTAHNDVDEVKLHIGEQEYPMWKTRTNGEFDFYEIEYQLGEDILRYCSAHPADFVRCIPVSRDFHQEVLWQSTREVFVQTESVLRK